MAHEQPGAHSATALSLVPPNQNPFFYYAEPAAKLPDAEPGVPAYVMVRSTGPVDPSECEELGAEAVEVTVVWGASVLHVAHLAPPRPFYVGNAESTGLDFLLPAEAAPFARQAIVEVEAGLARVVAPSGATLCVEGEAVAANGAVALQPGRRVEVVLGALRFRIAAVTAGKRVPRHIGAGSRSLGAALALSFASAAAFLGALAYYTPALGASLDDELDRDRLAVLRAYLDAHAERERDRPPPDSGSGAVEKGGGNPGTAAQSAEGKMGRPNRQDVQKRTAVRGDAPSIELSRSEALAEATSIGMIGLINTMNGRELPTALWGANVPNGPDSVDAWGNLFGEEPGESGGFGGLGLSGTGDGGGGYGRAIGLGRIGTCGANCGYGPGDKGGFGSSVGALGGSHRPAVPKVRTAVTTVSGRLPAEVIQRVVRQNYGRFRACYEGGLRTNPNLTGRVTARFIISRDGAVSNVSNGGSDLPNSGVVSCVLSAFYGLSFPSPENGIVTVSYPILLTPS